MNSKKKDYTSAIQNLLYCFPLYNYINKDEVNILVIGYSDISEKFIDFAFEVAQVSGYKLHITVVSDDVDTKAKYLNGRPSFTKFFNVDEQLVDDSYGTLLFNTVSFGNVEDDMFEILLNNENKKYAYLFVGSESDDFNLAIAKVCDDCRNLLESNFVINCVAETDSKDDSVNFIRRNDSIEKHEDYKTLKSMAFNCHLVWNYSNMLDMRKLQRQFLSNYNYISCFSYVISLKYKLASIGMEFLDATAPERFYNLINSKNPSDKKIIENMIANEHKRWNVNMICRGYRNVTSMEKFVNGIETKANGYHPCLVRGTGVLGLSNDEWKNNNCEKWDKAKSKEINSLDELDKVSVLLHREYKTFANKNRSKNLISQSDIDSILKLLENNIKAKKVFDKYYICLQEISAGNSAKTSLYEHYYSALIKEVNNLPMDQAKIIRKRINTLVTAFNVILESEKYIDYKQYDADLISKIPFILTYKSNLHIGIPIDLINIKPSVNSLAFRTVESALLINPSRITYICEFEKGDLNNLKRILEYAIKSMISHHLRSVINICLLTSCSLTEKEINTITDVSDRINSVEIIKDEDNFVNYSRRRHLQIFEFNRTRSSSIIERYEYCSKSNYKYNRNKNKFITTNCNEVRYIAFKQFLKISDLFEFKNSIDDYSFPDMQKDYMYFWSKYKSKSEAENIKSSPESIWKALCELLSEQDKNNKFEIKDIKKENIRKEYLVERVCLEAINKLCKQVKKANGEISCKIELHSNNSFNVSINAPSGFHKVIESLLYDTYKLYDSNSININVYNEKAFLYYNSLNTGVICSETIKKALDKFKNVNFEDIKRLLDEIQGKGYIRKLVCNVEKGISFSYCTHQVKEVMIQSGRILELYVYYKLLETGLFDDIANSVEIHWGNEEAENEIDIIATQGYKVLIIECKAQISLIQDYYNKLSRLDSDYGLNSIPVIVADTLEINKYAEDNQKMIEIGNRVGIHTVFSKNDISNIGLTLQSIVKNS
ncbi:MAG: DUF1887 family protein [Lachnospiraceae bacterium]|nr:DUF1887 family protein [Lachnospiraceae bacterium]